MSKLLLGLLSLGRKDGGVLMVYDDAKTRADDGDAGIRRKLAKRSNVQPKILYFLAPDADPAVRSEIAKNPSILVQADEILCRDGNEGVRCRIAEKIARLAPELLASERDRAGDIVTGILETLARDEALKIRQILANELKTTKGVSPSVIEQLARDHDDAVSGPVLKNSPLLSDVFLVEFIESGPVQDALQAISSRKLLTADVADAIVATDDEALITTLLSNKSTQVREETLDRLVDSAADVNAWHAPLVARPALSAGAVTSLSRFVANPCLRN